MELLEAIKLRRSIRKYKPAPIPESYITELIEAGSIGYPDQSPSQRPRLAIDEVFIKEI